ncbi:hypothetical protein K443DRAFT_673480 [Laccaria amethystina LaAM-08-1]|uniref:Uncharacterized protein n=1 Tax=Laccaria amethystina LaAM-08-1 TaxID=1095629 RepID=A0A0C9XZU0_9AGAR|nr:hypothetical protein K443DRAFT_673480 [Laccaria amethystina LaAM-08-1]
MDNYATADGQPGTLFKGERIQYLLYFPVEGLVTTKFTILLGYSSKPQPLLSIRFFCRSWSIGDTFMYSSGTYTLCKESTLDTSNSHPIRKKEACSPDRTRRAQRYAT